MYFYEGISFPPGWGRSRSSESGSDRYIDEKLGRKEKLVNGLECT